MKKILLCAAVLVSVLLTCVSMGQEKKEEERKNAIVKGPYLVDMKQDGVTIVWKTTLPSLSWVEIAPADDLPMYKQERPRFFQTVNGRKLTDRTLHAVRVTGLQPGTTYRYRIFSKDATWQLKTAYVTYGRTMATYENEKYSFTTNKNEEKDVNFIMVNDIHGRSDFMKDLLGEVKFGECDFVNFNGDMSSWITSEGDIFDGYLDAAVSLFATRIPLMYVRGNHETRGVMSHKFGEYFPTEDGKIYQVYYQGGVCFLSLDCGEDKPDTDIEYTETAAYDEYRKEEAKWLAQVVESDAYKNSRARVVFLHIPPTVGDWHGNDHLRETLMPILNKANVDVMLSGHTHRYSFHEPSEGAAFPILVNGNMTYVKGIVDKEKIKLDIIGKTPQENKSHVIPLKK